VSDLASVLSLYRGDTPPSDQRLEEEVLDATHDARLGFWRVGIAVAYDLGRSTKNKRENAKCINKWASKTNQTSNYVRLQVRCFDNFGAEYIKADVAIALYIACLHAGKRTGRPPHEILEEALDKEWHAAEVNALGKSEPETYEFRGECRVHGPVALPKIPPQSGIVRGIALPCPDCVALRWAEESDGRDAERVGVLGAAE
jgi:hypothetical protein